MVYFGDVEWIPLKLLRLLQCHDLDVEGPRRIVSSSDGVVQVPYRVIRVVGDQLVGLLWQQVSYSLITLS